MLHVFVIPQAAIRTLGPLRRQLVEISAYAAIATPADNEVVVLKDRYAPPQPQHPQALQDVLARLDTLLGIDSPTLDNPPEVPDETADSQ